jgi:hypothetical protein
MDKLGFALTNFTFSVKTSIISEKDIPLDHDHDGPRDSLWIDA